MLMLTVMPLAVGFLILILLAAGLALGELPWLKALGFLVAAGVAFVGFVVTRWSPMGYAAVLAVLDVVLVLWVFEGDLAIR